MALALILLSMVFKRRRSGRVDLLLNLLWTAWTLTILLKGQLSVFDAIAVALGIRWASAARLEGRPPIFSGLILVYIGGRWASWSVARPEWAFSVALIALILALVWHGVDGMRRRRRGEELDGSFVAWAGAIAAIPSLWAWGLLSLDQWGAPAWLTDSNVPRMAPIVLFLALLMMLVPRSWGITSWWNSPRRRSLRS